MLQSGLAASPPPIAAASASVAEPDREQDGPSPAAAAFPDESILASLPQEERPAAAEALAAAASLAVLPRPRCVRKGK